MTKDDYLDCFVLRTDLEQFKRKLFKDTLMVESSDYFEFEGNILYQ